MRTISWLSSTNKINGIQMRLICGSNRLYTVSLGVAFILILTFLQPAQAFDYFQVLPEQPMVPKDNPLTKAKIALGKRLFYDSALSKYHTHSCNHCHNLLTGGDDDKAFSTAPDSISTKRSAPGLWNIGLQTVLYWDGREKTLESQALDHLSDPAIMGFIDIKVLEQRLNQDEDYRKAFASAFNDPQALNRTNLAKALASFQRALMAPNSAFDRYIRGNKNALSQAAIKGMQEFNDAGCLACHFGTNFAGPAPGPAMKMGDGFYELFPNNLGSQYDQSHELTKDLGRYEYSKNPQEKYLWRVPSLRNIALTGPYFHNGSAKTLRDAVRIMAKTQFGNELSEEQLNNITAFLRSLTGEVPAVLQKP
jgi:cytochrome c peroxidase